MQIFKLILKYGDKIFSHKLPLYDGYPTFFINLKYFIKYFNYMLIISHIKQEIDSL